MGMGASGATGKRLPRPGPILVILRGRGNALQAKSPNPGRFSPRFLGPAHSSIAHGGTTTFRTAAGWVERMADLPQRESIAALSYCIIWLRRPYDQNGNR